MKKPIRSSLCLMALALCAAVATARPAETLRLRADTWMPYNGDPKSETPGYVVELLKIIFEPRGITVDYQNMPWADALKASNSCEIDGVIGASRIEGAKMIIPEECIAVTKIGLFVLKGNAWRYQTVESFNEVRLGAIDAYDYWEVLDGYIQKHSAPRVTIFKGDTPLKDGIAKLRAGEIDIMPEAIPVFTWELKSEGLNIADFRIAYIHEGDDAFVAFAPNAAGKLHAAIFDEGIRRLRANGQLAKILAKYGLEDWK
jgi:polar amino acid transport system substrate-binding protein